MTGRNDITRSISIDPNLEYIVHNFFEHPQKMIYWPRIARDTAASVCRKLVGENYLIPSAISFYQTLADKLERGTREHIPAGDRNRFLNAYTAAIHKGWIKTLPKINQRLPQSASLSDIEASSDLFMRFSPPLLRLDVLYYLQHITTSCDTQLSLSINLDRDRPITLNVPTSRASAVSQQLGICELYVEIVETDLFDEKLCQASDNWGDIHQTSNTTVGAILVDRTGQYYALTTAHGFIPLGGRNKQFGIYPEMTIAEGATNCHARSRYVLYMPEIGVDIALIKIPPVERGNMFNFSGNIRKATPTARLIKAGGKTGITSANLVELCCTGGISDSRAYQNLLRISITKPEYQSKPGDCGSIHCEETDINEFQPIGIHVANTSRFQFAVEFERNIRELFGEFDLNPDNFQFYNIREGTNNVIRLPRGTELPVGTDVDLSTQ